jgi:hypothetical protein
MAKAEQQLMTDLLFAALRVNDEQLNTLAAELFVRFGPGVVPPLVREACNRKNRPAHRLRVLEVIGRLAGDAPCFEADDFMNLHTLLHDRNPKVRRAAADLVGVGVEDNVRA